MKLRQRVPGLGHRTSSAGSTSSTVMQAAARVCASAPNRMPAQPLRPEFLPLLPRGSRAPAPAADRCGSVAQHRRLQDNVGCAPAVPAPWTGVPAICAKSVARLHGRLLRPTGHRLGRSSEPQVPGGGPRMDFRYLGYFRQTPCVPGIAPRVRDFSDNLCEVSCTAARQVAAADRSSPQPQHRAASARGRAKDGFPVFGVFPTDVPWPGHRRKRPRICRIFRHFLSRRLVWPKSLKTWPDRFFGFSTFPQAGRRRRRPKCGRLQARRLDGTGFRNSATRIASRGRRLRTRRGGSSRSAGSGTTAAARNRPATRCRCSWRRRGG